MTNSKNTKHALLASILSVVLCCAMLIGSTFAWFTDSASTAVNKIQAGTLDVALEMKDASGSWVTAEGQTLNWKKAAGAPAGEAVLWEPGCTYELPELRVRNNGSLALKYKLVVTGIVGDAKLLEAIDFTYGDGIDLNAEVPLAPKASTESIVIKGHMKEISGNEYQGLSIDGIGITVVAKQDTVEYDSFNNRYDAEAPFNFPTNQAVKVESGFYYDASASAFYITSADGFVAFTNYTGSMKNSTLYLCVNVDLEGKTITQMDGANERYSGMVIDGQGFTVSNMTINGSAQGGLFTRCTQITEIKNITFYKASVTSTGINVAVITGQVYNSLVLDNVNVTNSVIAAPYKAASLIGAVYDENPNKATTVTLRNCDVSATTVKATRYDFGTCGMVAFVYERDGESVVFENSKLANSTLDVSQITSTDYALHAWAYYDGNDSEGCIDEASGLTVIDCAVKEK